MSVDSITGVALAAPVPVVAESQLIGSILADDNKPHTHTHAHTHTSSTLSPNSSASSASSSTSSSNARPTLDLGGNILRSTSAPPPQIPGFAPADGVATTDPSVAFPSSPSSSASSSLSGGVGGPSSSSISPSSVPIDPRATPEYYAYYYQQRPLDPRLPPPLVNWSNWYNNNNTRKRTDESPLLTAQTALSLGSDASDNVPSSSDPSSAASSDFTSPSSTVVGNSPSFLGVNSSSANMNVGISSVGESGLGELSPSSLASRLSAMSMTAGNSVNSDLSSSINDLSSLQNFSMQNVQALNAGNAYLNSQMGGAAGVGAPFMNFPQAAAAMSYNGGPQAPGFRASPMMAVMGYGNAGRGGFQNAPFGYGARGAPSMYGNAAAAAGYMGAFPGAQQWAMYGNAGVGPHSGPHGGAHRGGRSAAGRGGHIGLGLPYKGGRGAGAPGGHFGMHPSLSALSSLNPYASGATAFSGSAGSGLGDAPSSSPRAAWLDDFRLNKAAASLTLVDVAARGLLLELATDQYGSRFIQQRLEVASAEEKEAAFQVLLPETLRLCTDVFGNYVVQKLLEYGAPEHQKQISSALLGNIFLLSLQMYGCRVVQKALDVCDLDTMTSIVRELAAHVMQCVKDQNGNHVVQKCVEKFSLVPPQLINYIVDTFLHAGQVQQLSIHPYGCRVIQRLLEHASETHRHALLTEILGNADELARNQYGNYVVQHVLVHGASWQHTAVINSLRGKLVSLSKHKFASNVVEKCFTHASRQDRAILLDEILGKFDNSNNNNNNKDIKDINAGTTGEGSSSAASTSSSASLPTSPGATDSSTSSTSSSSASSSPLLQMVKDQYGNYVVQKMLDVLDEDERELVVAKLKRHLPNLRKIPYGKHIIARLEKITGAPL